MTMAQRAEEAGHELAARMARLLGQIEQMADALPQAACATCGDTGLVYSPERGELVRCPACQPWCDECGGLGYVVPDVPADHPLFGQFIPCRNKDCPVVHEQQTRQLGVIRKYSALPGHYAALTFESFDALSDVERAGKESGRLAAGLWAQSVVNNDWDETDGRRDSLALYGLPGRGKTGLLSAAANYLIERRFRALYIRMPDLLEAVQKRYTHRDEGWDDDFGKDSAEEVIDAARESPALLIDECDVKDATISPNKRDIAEKIFRYRHGHQLPTFITTNRTPDQFEDRWGITIASVFFERSVWVPMTGMSLRAEAAHWGDDHA